jgi:hypothetical protein
MHIKIKQNAVLHRRLADFAAELSSCVKQSDECVLMVKLFLRKNKLEMLCRSYLLRPPRCGVN